MRTRVPICSGLFSVLVVAAAAGCGGSGGAAIAGADPAQGQHLIGFYGCGTCHVIGGIATANGHVGPSLLHLDDRRTIAGKLPNTPSALEHWIRAPQHFVPGNDMPDLGVSAAGAKNIAAYLYRQ
jgi:cytochrome c